MSNVETLAQNYAPSLVAPSVSTPRQSQRERERVEELEQRRDAQAAQASTEETAASPTQHIDEFGALDESGSATQPDGQRSGATGDS